MLIVAPPVGQCNGTNGVKSKSPKAKSRNGENHQALFAGPTPDVSQKKPQFLESTAVKFWDMQNRLQANENTAHRFQIKLPGEHLPAT